LPVSFIFVHYIEGRDQNLLTLFLFLLKDGHVDLPILLRGFYHNHINNRDWAESFENGTLPGQVDLLRLRQGQSGGAFWSVYAPCPENGNDFSDANLAPSMLLIRTESLLTGEVTC
jgi:membrane dipeptidase